MYCDLGKKTVFISSESYFCCGSDGVILEVNDFSKVNATSVGSLIREYGLLDIGPLLSGDGLEKSRKVGGLEMNSLLMNVKWCSMYLHIY